MSYFKAYFYYKIKRGLTGCTSQSPKEKKRCRRRTRRL
nr:MAG TPA: hypothetical protein [Caudoviricetes sp.]